MIKDDFKKFVERKSLKEKERKEIDWNQRRDEWLRYLEELYTTVQGFLNGYKDYGAIEVSKEKIELSEQYIGNYTTDILVIKIGVESIKLVPVGTLLIGSKGRVDMKGKRGIVRLVLVDCRRKSTKDHIKIVIGTDKEIDKDSKETEVDVQWKWRIVTAPPNRDYLELNDDTFLSALMEIAGD